MADLPISGLTTLSTYSTSDLIEILDVSDTTYASTGTNKKVTVQNLLTMVGLPGGTNNQVQTNNGSGGFGAISAIAAGYTLTDNGTGNAPTFQKQMVANSQWAQLSTNFLVPQGVTYVNAPTNYSGLQLTLPVAGTYVISGSIRWQLGIKSTIAGDTASLFTEYYDSTLGAAVAGSNSQQAVFAPQVTGTLFYSFGYSPSSSIAYTITVATVIQLWAFFSISGSPTNQISQLLSNSNGYCAISAIRIA